MPPTVALSCCYNGRSPSPSAQRTPLVLLVMRAVMRLFVKMRCLVSPKRPRKRLLARAKPAPFRMLAGTAPVAHSMARFVVVVLAAIMLDVW